MFRPCKWAIIRLFTELVRRLCTWRGEYMGDEISSYIVGNLEDQAKETVLKREVID
jgi:hypothetical protein